MLFKFGLFTVHFYFDGCLRGIFLASLFYGTLSIALFINVFKFLEFDFNPCSILSSLDWLVECWDLTTKRDVSSFFIGTDSSKFSSEFLYSYDAIYVFGLLIVGTIFLFDSVQLRLSFPSKLDYLYTLSTYAFTLLFFWMILCCLNSFLKFCFILFNSSFYDFVFSKCSSTVLLSISYAISFLSPWFSLFCFRELNIPETRPIIPGADTVFFYVFGESLLPFDCSTLLFIFCLSFVLSYLSINLDAAVSILGFTTFPSFGDGLLFNSNFLNSRG